MGALPPSYPSTLPQRPPWTLSAANFLLFSTLTSELWCQTRPQQAGPGRAVGNRLEIWRSCPLEPLKWSDPSSTLHPTRLLQREKGRLPVTHIQPEASSHMAASRNVFDHLNPGYINSPNSLNSQRFSLVSNEDPFPGSLEHPVATQDTGGGRT